MLKLYCSRASISAAAEFLHKDLDVHRSDGARGGIDAVLPVCRGYHGSFHAGNIQKFIRRLCRDDTLLEFIRDGNGNAAIKLRILHKLIPCQCGIHIDLEKLKKELEEELKGKLDPLASPIQTLMDAGGEVFDKFITTEKKDDNLLNDFDRIFDVDLDDEKPVEKKDEIQDLLSYYDLAGEFDIDEDALDEDEKDDKALSYDEVIPEEEEKPIPDEVLAEKSIFEATDNEDELPYELNEEEKKMLETISQNVNRKPEKRSEASLSGANKELDTIFSELVEAEDDKEDVKKEEIEEVKQPTINRIQELSLAEIPEEERKKFIENPLVDVSIAEKKQEEEKEPEPVYPEQVDKDDIIKLMKDIQPMSDVYYNKIENFIDQQEKQKSEPVEAKKEEVREEKKEDSYISSLIDDLKNKMLYINERLFKKPVNKTLHPFIYRHKAARPLLVHVS